MMTANRNDSLRKMIVAMLGLGVLAIFLTAFITGAGAPPARERGAAPQQDAGMVDAVGPLMAKLKGNPDDKEAVSRLAHIFTRAEDWEKAAPFWTKLVALEPGNIGTRYHYGFTLMQLNRFPEAVEQYEAILKTNPGESAAHYYLGIINKYELEKIDAARKHFQQALDGTPDDRELVAEIRKELGSMK